jgi:transposase InsO family protein
MSDSESHSEVELGHGAARRAANDLETRIAQTVQTALAQALQSLPSLIAATMPGATLAQPQGSARSVGTLDIEAPGGNGASIDVVTRAAALAPSAVAATESLRPLHDDTIKWDKRARLDRLGSIAPQDYRRWSLDVMAKLANAGLTEALQPHPMLAQLGSRHRIPALADGHLSVFDVWAAVDVSTLPSEAARDRYRWVYAQLYSQLRHLHGVTHIVDAVPRDNAPELWARLKQLCSATSSVTAREAQTKLRAAKRERNESMRAFINRLDSLAAEAAAHSHYAVADWEMKELLLFGSGVGHDTRTRLMEDNRLTYAETQARVLEWERSLPRANARAVPEEALAPMALAAHATPKPSKHKDKRNKPGKPAGNQSTCHNCGGTGHFASACPSAKRDKAPAYASSSNAKGGKWCDYHKHGGHNTAECRAKKAQDNAQAAAYSVAVSPLSDSDAELENHYVELQTHPELHNGEANVAEAEPAKGAPFEAIIDSGASHHMVKDSVPLEDVQSTSRAIATATGPATADDLQLGTLQLPAQGDFLVPVTGKAYQSARFSKNLLSKVQLLGDMPGASHWIDKADSTALIDGSGHTLLVGTVRNGIYYASTHPPGGASKAHAEAADALHVALIHHRLGHMGAVRARQLAASGAVKGLTPELLRADSAAHTDCAPCLQGKLTHRPVPSRSEESRPQRPLERVDADLAGPLPLGLNEERYWLVLVDRYSGYIWARPLRSKDETSPIIRHWWQATEKQLGKATHPLGHLHTDRGGEFTAASLVDSLRHRGVTVTYSPVERPQHNGAAERANRTLAERARTMMIAAKAPHALWPHAVRAAAALYNFTTVRGNTGKTALQLLTGRDLKVRLDRLHPWGCDGYARLPDSQVTTKLDAVSKRMIFIGYSPEEHGREGYIMLDPQTLRSRQLYDVRFVDNSFAAMTELRERLAQANRHADEPDDERYYEAIALDNETRLVQQISTQEHAGQPAADEAAEHQPADTPPIPADTRTTPGGNPATNTAPGPNSAMPMREAAADAVSPISLDSDYSEYETANSGGPSDSPAPRTRGIRKDAAHWQRIVGTRHPSTRNAKGVARYGMVDPRDIGQAYAAIQELQNLEREATAAAFAADAEAPARQDVPVGIKNKQRDATEQVREAARADAIDKTTNNRPLPPDRPPCNKQGEIVTPTQRCTATNARGKQCGAFTRYADRCWRHQSRDIGARIAKSKIAGAGKGIIATRDLPPGYRLTPYTGDLAEGAAARNNLGGSHYVFQISNNAAVDAARRDTAVGRMANDPRGTRQRPNLRWVVDRARKTVRLETTRRVRKGEELLVPYSAAYWRQHEQLQRQKCGNAAAPAADSDADNADNADAAVSQPPQQPDSDSSAQEQGPPAAVKLAAAQRKPSTVSKRRPIRTQRQTAALLHSLHAHAVAVGNSHIADPSTYDEAMRSEQATEWQQACQAEIDSLMHKGVFEPVPKLPAGKNLMSTRWVFKAKYDSNGVLEKFKARLVVRGFSQREGEDYFETYAPTMLFESFRVLCATACALGYELKVLDFVTAFLNAPLDEELYVRAPPGSGALTGKTLRLRKALYGLKQAGRQWNLTLVDELRQRGYKQCEHSDECILTRTSRSGRPIFIGIYVDDLPYAYHGADAAEMQGDIDALKQQFELKELGNAQSILGMRVTYNRKERWLKLDHEAKIDKLLRDSGLEQCNPASTPGSPALWKLLKDGPTDELKALSSQKAHTDTHAGKHSKLSTYNYRSILGQLLHLVNTRPDIAHEVNVAARHGAEPTSIAVAALKRIVRYLAGTRNIGLLFQGDAHCTVPMLHAFSDADWASANDEMRRRSTSGVLIKLSDGPVSWLSKRQTLVALSTAEAEYIAACRAAQSIYHLRVLCAEMGIPQLEPTPLAVDNESAVRAITAEAMSKMTKFVAVRYHYVRQMERLRHINVHWVPTKEQEADIFTKCLSRDNFLRMRQLLLGQ